MTAIVRETEGCGAEIANIAVPQATDAEINLIRDTVYNRGVAFLHDQQMSPEEQMRTIGTDRPELFVPGLSYEGSIIESVSYSLQKKGFVLSVWGFFGRNPPKRELPVFEGPLALSCVVPARAGVDGGARCP